MLLVCGGLGWLIHDIREQEAVVKMIEELNGSVQFGEQSFLGRMGVVRSLFGEHAFAKVYFVRFGPETTNAHIVQLKKLKGLQSLSLHHNQVSDLSPLAGMSELTMLDLYDIPVSDLTPLAGLTGLTWLDLGGTQVSDLSPLATLANLQQLYLTNTPASDEEVDQLQQALPNCNITRQR